ncbi:MAG: hypothetical protein M1272_01975 [Firmicutes bacterium]|nr:hypothetical protein [Bacillota bacterium]
MRPSRAGSTVRMVLGSAIGVVGFARLSLGFVHLNASIMLAGVVQILLGTFLTMGLMAPLRKPNRRRNPPPDKEQDLGTP